MNWKNIISFSNHHLFQKCDWWNNHYDNMVRMPHTQHMALHTFFWDCSLPIDKINKILEFHSSVLCNEVVNEVNELLQFWKKEWKEAYNPKVFNKYKQNYD